MLSRGKQAYRFAMSAQEKQRLKENQANDAKNIFKKFQLLNARKAIGDFDSHVHSISFLEKS